MPWLLLPSTIICVTTWLWQRRWGARSNRRLRQRPLRYGEGRHTTRSLQVREWVRVAATQRFLHCRIPWFDATSVSYWAMVAAVTAFFEVGSDMILPFAALLEQTRPSTVVVDVAT